MCQGLIYEAGRASVLFFEMFFHAMFLENKQFSLSVQGYYIYACVKDRQWIPKQCIYAHEFTSMVVVLVLLI